MKISAFIFQPSQVVANAPFLPLQYQRRRGLQEKSESVMKRHEDSVFRAQLPPLAMKIIPTSEADNYWLLPIWEADDKFKRTPGPAPFPSMRASDMSLVFSSGYMVALADWWQKWKDATGFKYEPGSQMCESGTKVLIAHVHESLTAFRGVGRVAQETLEQARHQGVTVPTERIGDFSPEIRELRIEIPSGLSVNGVTDGGHSTPGILVEEPDGRVRPVFFEWQSGAWSDYAEALARGVIVHDCID